MVNLYVDVKGVEEVINSFEMSIKDTNIATKRAMKRTLDWIRSKSVKEISVQTGIQARELRKRFKIKVKSNGLSGVVWYGILPVSLIHLKPKKTKTGIKAGIRGQIVRQGAFIAPRRSGDSVLQVYKRTGSTRFPIDKQTEIIKTDVQTFISKIKPELEKKLLNELRHQLKWQATRT